MQVLSKCIYFNGACFQYKIWCIKAVSHCHGNRNRNIARILKWFKAVGPIKLYWKWHHKTGMSICMILLFNFSVKCVCFSDKTHTKLHKASDNIKSYYQIKKIKGTYKGEL